MKFKIKTADVRKAIKKTNLKVACGKYYGIILSGNHKVVTDCACPIGQLYTAATGECGFEDSAQKWAWKKFGKCYTFGFVNGFDGREKWTKDFNKSEVQDYLAGYANGKALRKSLLKETK